MDITSHQNGSLLLAGDRVRFQGSVEDTTDRTYTEVEVRLEQYRDGSKNPVELLDWRKAGGDPRRGTLTSPSTTTGWTRTRITRSSLPEPAPTAEMCRPPMCGG